jgi:regulator of RNase E activity RraA
MKDSRVEQQEPDKLTVPRGVAAELLEGIRRFDTCTIANAIEQFGVRLRNEGYTHEGLKCVTAEFPQILGYAATFHVRSSEPSLTGHPYVERTDWWSAIERLPVPRIAVIQDLDAGRGFASCAGEVHAAILKAFRCEGVITNGAVRDIPALRRMNFPMFARAIAVSHSYSHLVDFGSPVEVFGLTVQCGDLLYADCHGAVCIPHQIVAELPAAAEKIWEHEQRIVDLCQSPDFSPEQLLKILRRTD